MRSYIYGLLALSLGGCGTTTVAIQGAGKVPWQTLCESEPCGAQGQVFVPAKNSAQPLGVASVGMILGTKLPRNSIYANPDNCGGYTSEQQWFASTPIDKVVDLTETNKSELAAGLEGQLAKNLASSAPDANAKAGLTAAIDKATASSIKSQYHYVVTVYTLKPDAYLDRVKVCKPTDTEAVVRSIAVVEASGGALEDIKSTLAANLKADGSIAAVIGAGSANVAASIDNATDQAVKTTLGDSKALVVIVVGFDK